MDIFYDGFRTCKKCKRDLPNNSLHFPTDKSCKDGLRSVCRECNPKYGRFLELNHRTNTKWSNEDLEKLEYWKSKHTKYYDIAVRVWSISDVNKRNIAEKNNLNYLEFWNINEAERWIEK